MSSDIRIIVHRTAASLLLCYVDHHEPAYEWAERRKAQDLSVAQLRFFAALGNDRPDPLFFAGDPGQRIFQAPFSWADASKPAVLHPSPRPG